MSAVTWIVIVLGAVLAFVIIVFVGNVIANVLADSWRRR